MANGALLLTALSLCLGPNARYSRPLELRAAHKHKKKEKRKAKICCLSDFGEGPSL
jgi:hypothetical protein